MASVMITVELEVEVFFQDLPGHDVWIEQALCHTIVPPCVQEWACDEASKRLTKEY